MKNSMILRKDTLSSKEKDLSEKKKYKNILSMFSKFASLIWFIGFLSIGTFILAANLQFKKRSNYFNSIIDPKIIHILNRCKEKLNINKKISIYFSNKWNSPFIYVFFHPRIYIKEDLLKMLNEAKLSYILFHELGHYKRKDLLYNLLEALALMLHWFNPIIWFAIKEMKSCKEIACDAFVLEHLEEKEALSYGKTILKLSNIFLNNDYKKILPSYFYEKKSQIERRINMIKIFKKGSYKMSAMGIICFILLGCITLTNANDTKSIPTLIEEKNKEFEFNIPYKHFNNLDRALDFIDFDFKIPDFLPSDYELDRISFNEEKSEIDIDFWIRYFKNNNEEEHFYLTISKENIVEKLKKQSIKNNTEFIEDPLTISNRKGVHIFTKSAYEEPKNMNKKHIYLSNLECKYFVWEEDNLWYSINYYTKITDKNADSGLDKTSLDEISKEDMEKIISSMKKAKEIQNIDYISKHWKEHFDIYGEKDLKKAKDLLGFSPKLPLSLSSNFVPIHSRVYEFLYIDQEAVSMAMQTIFDGKDKKNSESSIELMQTKNTFFYDQLNHNGYFKDKKKDTDEIRKVSVNTLSLDNIKVFTYKEQQSTCYLWKKNDVIYEAEFIGNIDDQEEIVKALINEKSYKL